MVFIPVAEPVIGEKEIEYVIDALKSGWVSSLGVYIEKFEKAFADYLGVDYAISVGNGTEGLHLAFHALGIGVGDEVIVPDLTFVATAHSVIQTGAEPVFVDIDPNSFCIDSSILEDAISEKTKAIAPVHLYGQPANMSEIQMIAKKHDLFIIEDAAEAHGAEFCGKKVGSFGDVGVFSFYGNKLITTGEGGMVVTNDSNLASRLRFLKDHGMSPKRRYYHSELAFNYRMTNIQAALGLAQLEQIDLFIEKKQQILDWYREDLVDLSNISFNPGLSLSKSVNWLTCLLLQDDFPISREILGKELRSKGIDWRPFFIPMHELPHLSKYKRFGDNVRNCTISSKISSQGMNLPSGCNLTRSSISYVTDCIKEIYKNYTG